MHEPWCIILNLILIYIYMELYQDFDDPHSNHSEWSLSSSSRPCCKRVRSYHHQGLVASVLEFETATWILFIHFYLTLLNFWIDCTFSDLFMRNILACNARLLFIVIRCYCTMLIKAGNALACPFWIPTQPFDLMSNNSDLFNLLCFS